MNISPDSIAKKDKDKLLEIDALQGIDSTHIAQIKENVKHLQRNLYSEKLNNIARKVFEKNSDKNVLKDALRWSKRSLEIYPNNPLWLDTYANLLYKLGQNEEAITKEKEALSYAKKEDMARFEKTILKMKTNEKTWKQE